MDTNPYSFETNINVHVNGQPQYNRFNPNPNIGNQSNQPIQYIHHTKESEASLKDTINDTIEERETLKQRISSYLVNDGVKIAWIVMWVLVNLGLFSYKFHQYTVGNKEFAFRTLSWGAPLARASAICISFNSALMLITVMRNFLSWVRGSFIGGMVPVDKNIIFHRYIAYTIAFFTLVHVAAHFYNFYILSVADLDTLAHVGRTKTVPLYISLFATLPGLTGVIISIVMILMYVFAMKRIRGPRFNLFWYVHHLFIVYFFASAIHGAARLLEKETFYLFVIGPAFFYAFERTVRILRGSQDTILLAAIAHPSKVIELQMKKHSFHYIPGQYLFLNCPYLSNHEWHPFTISSAPEEEFVSVHIRVVGDWTTDLWNYLNPDKKLGLVQENLVCDPKGNAIFRIDGPYGAASEDVFTHGYKTILLCAGGIGVTPFASILKSVRYRMQLRGVTSIQKVYFYWISRDKHAFEWFNDILLALENQNTSDFLEIHTYLTERMRISEIRQVIYGGDDGLDQITGLQSPTHFGRPDWNNIFKNLSNSHKGEDVGVFFCGPSILSKQLYQICRKYTNSSKNGTRFSYHKENF